MTDRRKKLLIVIAFVSAVILIALAIYYLFFRPFITPPTPTLPPTLPPIGLPTVPPALNIPTAINLNVPTIAIPGAITPSITPIIPGPTISDTALGGLTSFKTLVSNSSQAATLSTNGRDLLYHDTQTGFFYQITPDGDKKLYSDTPFFNVDEVTWDPNNQKAVLEYPDGSNIIYDFQAKKSVTLPAQWKDFTFSNKGSQIAFKDMRLDPENRYLSVSNADGTGYKQIEKINDEDANVHVSWSPGNEYIALYRESIDGSRSDVYPIGFNGENYRKFRIEGRDMRFEWAPSGDKLLYSAYNSRSNYNPTLWVVNSDPELLGSGRTKIGLDTWADKCTFASETTVYCAVPRSLETGTGFMPSLANDNPDDIYKINILTGAKELIAQPVFPTSINSLIITENNDSLYWLENDSNQIKNINL